VDGKYDVLSAGARRAVRPGEHPKRCLDLGARECRRWARGHGGAGRRRRARSQQQQLAVDVGLVGVEHFDLGLSLLQLHHRNVRRRALPGALVKIGPAGAEA
jgi:hypothetical protein